MTKLTAKQRRRLTELEQSNKAGKVVGWSEQHSGPILDFNGHRFVVTKDGGFEPVESVAA